MEVLLIPILPAALYLYLLYRLSAYRKDRAANGARFGKPYESMTQVLSKANYTEEGQRLLPWLAGSIVMVAAAFLVTLGLLARRL